MYSAADIKGNRAVKTRIPKGKCLSVYNYFIAHQFEPIHNYRLTEETGLDSRQTTSMIIYLRDMYDMEIVRARHGVWIFAGFIDFNGKLV